MNDTMSMPGDGRTIDERDLVTWIRMQAEDVDRYVFGIAGPPGSGKSTVANRIGSELGAPVVPMDGFHLTNEVLRSCGVRDIKEHLRRSWRLRSSTLFEPSGIRHVLSRARSSTEPSTNRSLA